MVRVMVCQHVGYELLGTLNPLFKEAGFRIRYVNFGRNPEAKPELDGYDGLVLLGGPMSVEEEARYPHLGHEIRMIESALKKEIPVLGICLGSQLLAKALGAEVRRNKVREIGWHEISLTEKGVGDRLLSHFEPKEKIFQWHGDTFEIPRGAEHLALSEDCRNQAFRYGEKAYGLQFHLECDEALIERWLVVPQHRRELEEVRERTCPDTIRNQTPENIGRMKHLSRRTFGEFLRLFGEEKKYRCPPSR